MSEQMNHVKGRLIQKADELFDNLVSVEELQVLAAKWLRKPITADTIYKWVTKGIPSEMIKGKRYFPLEKAAMWIRRT